MTIDEIIDYVSNTPENSNPAVLKAMLEQLEGTGGGSGSSGGSSSDVNITIVNIVYSDEHGSDMHLDRTFDEMKTAWEQGLILIKGEKYITINDESTDYTDTEVDGISYSLVLDIDFNNKFISTSNYGPFYPYVAQYYYSGSIFGSGAWYVNEDSNNYPIAYYD